MKKYLVIFLLPICNISWGESFSDNFTIKEFPSHNEPKRTSEQYNPNKKNSNNNQQQPTHNGINRWNIQKRGVLLANQSYFSNWVSGGVDNFSATLFGDVTFNKQYGPSFLEGQLRFIFGLSSQNSSVRKTEDQIDTYFMYAHKLVFKNYYGVIRVGLKTQVAKGYNYKNDTRTLISSLLSPGYLNTGIGIMLKDEEKNLDISVYPMNTKNTLVVSNKIDGTNYGVKDGKNMLSQTGIAAILNHEATVMENINVYNTLDLFFDYGEFSTIDINWQIFVNMKINRLLSADIIAGLTYDKDINIEGTNDFRFKELFGLGLSYNFN